jgi:hypothetical protein
LASAKDTIASIFQRLQTPLNKLLIAVFSFLKAMDTPYAVAHGTITSPNQYPFAILF